jgi:methyltransferase (TIGR00027 family)
MAKARPGGNITVADTAKWVAMYRAIESERPDAIFHDPLARRLAGERGEAIFNAVPRARTFGSPMIVRTAVIDDLLMQALAQHGVDLVVNLAAGFDTRPYRMPLPATLQWVEVDYPQTMEEKAKLLEGEAPGCKLERIGADLSNAQARPSLFDRIGAMGTKGLVITEGLLVYLDSDDVRPFAQDLARQPAFGLWITDIVSPFVVKMMRLMWSRRLARAAFRFGPPEGAAFFAPYGWRLEQYRSIFVESRRLRREAPMAWSFPLLFPRAAKQEATRREGPMTGTILLSRRT